MSTQSPPESVGLIQSSESMLQHLQRRNCNVSLHNPAIDEENYLATFYLWNLSGGLVGFQQYNPRSSKKKSNCPRECRYYTYRKQPTVSVFGVESLYLSETVFIFEGIFDACRMISLGYSSIATLSNDPKELRDWIWCLNRKTVSVCDNDKAGIKLKKYSDNFIVCPEKDFSDSSDEFVKYVIETYGQ